MPKLRVPGYRTPENEDKSRDYLGITATTVLATRVEGARGSVVSTERVDTEDEQVVKIVLDDNVTLWTSVEDARRDYGINAGSRGEASTDLIPVILPIGRAERSGGWFVKALELINVKLGGELENAAARVVVEKLEENFEKRVGKGGLFALDEDGSIDRKKKIPAAGDPFLVFVHGTASSTDGGFGKLFRQDDWRDVYARYKGRVLAFDHRTLSVSPLQNALDLVELLPDGAKIDLVSHSRGGLVCELVCRSMRIGEDGHKLDPFDDTDETIIRKSRASSDLKDQEKTKTIQKELALLTKLNSAIRNKKLTVQQLVRVACPTRGTTLASRRLDRYLSLVVNLIGLIPGLAANPIYDLTMGLLLAVAKKRTDPVEVPGLEAQMPESPLVAMVNRQDVILSNKLSVIAGDIEGQGILGRLKVLATDLFYLADHDLVVNTKAMYGGARRVIEPMFLLDRGGGVNHFSYFMNGRTASAISGTLQERQLADMGFQPVADRGAPRTISRTRTARTSPAPTVFVLPGTMGSQLSLSKSLVWFGLSQIVTGGIKKLKWGASNIAPDGVFEKYYGGLVEFLSDTHNVVPFDYDWRKSTLDEGVRLADLVEKRLSISNEPIRFIAHSMGGLVVRAMAVQKPETWKKVLKNPGARFVMLGTPNLGSFSIISTLMGRDKTIRQLAMIDFTHTIEELLTFISKFPGVLELLPRDEAGSFYTSSMWQQLRKHDDSKWPAPFDVDLKTADETWAKLSNFVIDNNAMAYVAGFDSELTPAGIKIEADKKRVTLLGTHRGDGRVPWATGIPAGIPVWYNTNCVHGDLARDKDAFSAYFDLLTKGTTSRLKTDPPAISRAATELIELKREAPEVYPTADEALDALMGSVEKKPELLPAQAKSQVVLFHGDLQFAINPVTVGHYLGDTLAGPEKALDSQLSGRLTNMRALGVYPGEVGSAEVVLHWDEKPLGAVIIGLGRFGELTPEALKTSFAFGFRKYIFAAADTPNLAVNKPLDLATLIIGHRESRLNLRQSIVSMLEGLIDANVSFTANGMAPIKTLRIVELYEETAIEALDILRDLADDSRFNKYFDIEKSLKTIRGGQRRLRGDRETGWWRRLKVESKKLDGYRTSLKFTDLSAGAQAVEVKILQQSALIDRLVDDAMGSSATSPEMSKKLFELLTPPSFKPYAAERRDLTLIVDERSAEYPWELLHDKMVEEPLTVRARAVRQLVDASASYTPIRANDRSALVIGDTVNEQDSGFIDLRGAQDEAKAVGKLLESADYQALVLDRKPVQEITDALFLKGSRILHVAAHGVVDYGPSKVTGIVLGSGVFFTPAEVERLRPFPELVFLNCCHLGNTKPTTDMQTALWSGRHRLAASLAVQFIRNGAKAVVAAGWAINDEAAADFAKIFYERMVAGHTFADAVFNARRYIYEKYRNVNTWGAYQCYGDPDYTLRTDAAPKWFARSSFGSVEETLVEIENLCASFGTASQDLVNKSKDRLAALRQRIPDDCLKDPRIQERLGQAYADVLLYDEAVEFYSAALAGSGGAVRLKSAEQLINIRVKNAIRRWKLSKENPARLDDKRAKHEILLSIKQLRALMDMIGAGSEANKQIGRTVERLSLLGSAYKRLAMIEAGERRKKALGEGLKYYSEAYELSQRSTSTEAGYYPAVNWQLLEVLKGNSPDDALLAQVDKDAQIEEARDPNFWALITVMDIEIVRALAKGKGEDSEKIIGAFRRAWRRGGSYREGKAILEQLDFIATILGNRKTAFSEQIGKIAAAVEDELKLSA